MDSLIWRYNMHNSVKVASLIYNGAEIYRREKIKRPQEKMKRRRMLRGGIRAG